MDVTPNTTEPDDTPGVDVSPRPVVPSRKRKGIPALIGIAVVLVAGVFLLTKAVGDASVFFLNADEVVAKEQKGELSDKRFRLQGNVVPGTTERTGNGVAFKVAFNGVEVPVNHVGDPPDLFQDCIPVVLEGKLVGSGAEATFNSDLMVVKHDNTYDAENPDRIKEADAANCGGVSRPPADTSSTP
jgi:cytochrome c-type biogenesis protein CcmE